MPAKAIVLALLLAAGAASPSLAHPRCPPGKLWIAGACRIPHPPWHRCRHGQIRVHGVCEWPQR